MADARTVDAMFGRIAGVYDFLNHFLSFGIDKIWRKELAQLVVPGANNLIADIAAGTLDVALAIHKAHPDVIVPAIDFCPQMLVYGLRKIKGKEGSFNILPCAGDALHMPLKDRCADSLTIAFGIRNISQRNLAFQEMLRILAPGGRACILEFGSGRERIWAGVYNIYLRRILPIIGAIVAQDKSAYSYLSKTIMNFPAAQELAAEMSQAGFVNVDYRKLTSGIVCLHWGEKPLS